MKCFRGLNGYRFLGYMGTALIYPVYSLITSEGKLIRFIDATTIVALVFLTMGIVLSLARHGDFDIFEYVTRRSASTLRHQRFQSFFDFREEKEEKRKKSANYPLLTGSLLLILSGLLAAFAY